MENEFALLSQFLEEMSGPEVSGRGSRKVTDEEHAKIDKFAAGGLNAKERAALLPTLIDNEKALQDLVEAIKSHQK